MEPTPIARLDEAVETLRKNATRWATLGADRRAGILESMIPDTLAAAEPQVRDACRAKGLPFDSPLAAEDWLGGPSIVLRGLRLYARTLRRIAAGGSPLWPRSAEKTRPDGQVVVRVFPSDFRERLLFPGVEAEVWMEPGVSSEALPDLAARPYREGLAGQPGKVALVLGAGNVASIGPMDALHHLVVENRVVLLKMNPVNEYLGPHIERAFRVLVEEGFLRVVYGGSDVGAFLVEHSGIDHVHITGSAAVHDTIVWGPPGPAREEAKRSGRARLAKSITSELGCVTPVIVVPGDWSERELEFQAANVATMVANNCSFNCNAAKVLVTHRAWPARQDFLARVERTLGSLPTRRAYYPGSAGRYERFLAAHPDARKLAPPADGAIPWTVIPDLDPERPDEIAFREEAWCPILAETSLEAADAGEFLARAVDFANERIWGTLSASVLVDPRTQKALDAAFEDAIGRLRYGGIGINHWAALLFALVTPTWGGYPGHTLEDVGSGIGVVHNAYLFDRPQKSVLRGPFTFFPKPPWFSTHRAAHRVAPKLVRFEASPSVFKVPGIALRALMG